MLGLGFSLAIEKRAAGGAAPPPSAPVNIVLPVITGTPAVGNILSGSDGTWTGYPSPTFTYQWNRGGTPIGGATASLYIPVTADAGTNLTFTVTAHNTSGDVSATSASVLVAGISISLSASSIPAGSANGTVLGTASVSGSYTGTPAYSISDVTETFQMNSITGVVTVADNTALVAGAVLPVTITVAGTTPVPTPLSISINVTAVSGTQNYPGTLLEGM